MSKKKGITLLDALVSLVILATGFMMILTIVPGTAVFIKSSENNLLAKQIGQTYIEYYSSPEHWSEMTTGGFAVSGQETLQTTVNGKASSTRFTWSAISSQYTGSVSGKLYNLTVTVTWREQYLGKVAGSGDIKQIELATIVVNPR